MADQISYIESALQHCHTHTLHTLYFSCCFNTKKQSHIDVQLTVALGANGGRRMEGGINDQRCNERGRTSVLWRYFVPDQQLYSRFVTPLTPWPLQRESSICLGFRLTWSNKSQKLRNQESYAAGLTSVPASFSFAYPTFALCCAKNCFQPVCLQLWRKCNHCASPNFAECPPLQKKLKRALTLFSIVASPLLLNRPFKKLQEAEWLTCKNYVWLGVRKTKWLFKDGELNKREARRCTNHCTSQPATSKSPTKKSKVLGLLRDQSPMKGNVSNAN